MIGIGSQFYEFFQKLCSPLTTSIKNRRLSDVVRTVEICCIFVIVTHQKDFAISSYVVQRGLEVEIQLFEVSTIFNQKFCNLQSFFFIRNLDCIKDAVLLLLIFQIQDVVFTWLRIKVLFKTFNTSLLNENLESFPWSKIVVVGLWLRISWRLILVYLGVEVHVVWIGHKF